MIFTTRTLLLAAALALSPFVGPAQAATVAYTYNPEVSGEARLVYRAGPGEANHVALSFVSGRLTVTDTGATIVPGRGCAAVTPGEVRCGTTPEAPGFLSFDLATGDQDDVVAPITCAPRVSCSGGVSGGVGNDSLEGPRAEGAYARLEGGPGRDVLRGGSWSELRGAGGNDTLLGGSGPDRLFGGPGADTFRGGRGFDEAYYYDTSRPVSVDVDGLPNDGTRGERDNVGRDVEGIVGSRHADRLVGNELENQFWAGDGDDVVIGRRGNDYLRGYEGDDVLAGGPGADVLDVSPETPTAYEFFAYGRDTLLGGPGNDAFEGKDGVRDVIRGGAGRDTARLDRRLDSWRGIERLTGDQLTG